MSVIDYYALFGLFISYAMHATISFCSCSWRYFYQIKTLNPSSNSRCRWPVEWLGSGTGFCEMDYCNFILTGVPQSSIDPLQNVSSPGTREHIIPVLRSLHWLSVKFCITFKLCFLIQYSSRVCVGCGPVYLTDMVTTTMKLFHHLDVCNLYDALHKHEEN